MALFPQTNADGVITQTPYSDSLSFSTITQDVETGMRFSFPLRTVALDGFPTAPLGKFGVNYSNITDDEVAVLLTFFRSMKGRKGTFGFLDPGGNLLKYSEDFSQSYWDKSVGPVTISGPTTDPFGGNRATALVGGGVNAYLVGIVGPGTGLNNVVACASVWVKSPDNGARLLIGFFDSTFTTLSSTDYKLVPNTWMRISHTAKLWSDLTTYCVIGGEAEWAGGRTMNLFGAMVSSMKGEGGYIKTPGNYGYHQYCRFDTDSFSRNVQGPNQNQLNLPIFEFNGSAAPASQLGTNQVGVEQQTSSTSATTLGTPDEVTISLNDLTDVVVGYFADEASYGGSGHVFDDLYLDGTFVVQFDSGVLVDSTPNYAPIGISWTYDLGTLAAGVHTIEVRHKTAGQRGSWADRILTTALP